MKFCGRRKTRDRHIGSYRIWKYKPMSLTRMWHRPPVLIPDRLRQKHLQVDRHLKNLQVDRHLRNLQVDRHLKVQSRNLYRKWCLQQDKKLQDPMLRGQGACGRKHAEGKQCLHYFFWKHHWALACAAFLSVRRWRNTAGEQKLAGGSMFVPVKFHGKVCEERKQKPESSHDIDLLPAIGFSCFDVW